MGDPGHGSLARVRLAVGCAAAVREIGPDSRWRGEEEAVRDQSRGLQPLQRAASLVSRRQHQHGHRTGPGCSDADPARECLRHRRQWRHLVLAQHRRDRGLARVRDVRGGSARIRAESARCRGIPRRERRGAGGAEQRHQPEAARHRGEGVRGIRPPGLPGVGQDWHGPGAGPQRSAAAQEGGHGGVCRVGAHARSEVCRGRRHGGGRVRRRGGSAGRAAHHGGSARLRAALAGTADRVCAATA